MNNVFYYSFQGKSNSINNFKTNSHIKGSPNFRDMSSNKGTGNFGSNSELNKIANLRLKTVSLPFKANSYANYMELTHSLFRQGMLSFFKGNFIRWSHMMLFHYLRINFSLRIDQYTGGNFVRNQPFIKEFIVATFADFILHPLHLAEARFILQSRHLNFWVYPSTLAFLKRSYSEMWKGIFLHIPRNAWMALSGVSYLANLDIRLFYLQSFIMHSIAYPFLVVQRRLECQSEHIGMLPKRYKNYFDATKQMIKQEGLRSLYKGFSIYSIAIFIWISTVPSITQLCLYYSPWMNQDKRDIRFKNESNSEYDEEDILDEDIRASRQHAK